MLSIFPTLLDFDILAVTTLRVTAGCFFLWLAYRELFSKHTPLVTFLNRFRIHPKKLHFTLSVLFKGTIAVLLIVGLFTQLAALGAGLYASLIAMLKTRVPNLSPAHTSEFFVLLAIVSFSLLFLGPGILAFDLPL